MSKLHSSPPHSDLVPAVGYARCSTDEQETSVADQMTAVEPYAAKCGYQILRWYKDEGISGDDTENRPEFLRMIADAQDKGDFKAILCWDQDRFGRFSPHEASFRTWPLAKAGIQLVTVHDGPIDWNEFTEWLTYSVKQHGKHQYLKDLAFNVTRGLAIAAKNGSWLGSPPYAYGFDGPNKQKRLVLGDEGKVQIVKRIFHEFVYDGRAMAEVAASLNAEGVLSPGGHINKWRHDVVKTVLENPAYTGDYAGCRTAYGKYHRIKNGEVGKGDGRHRKPKEEWVVKRDNHQPIIDRATFDKAQAILAKGKRGHNKYTTENNPCILSRLLRCGRCGCLLHGLKSQQGCRYYECSNRHRNGKDACLGTTVREDDILRRIAVEIEQEYLSLDPWALIEKAQQEELQPGDLPNAFAKLKALVAPPQQPKTDRKRMEKQAKALAEKIDKAKRKLVLLDAEFIPTAQDEIRRWQTELDGSEQELRERPPTEQDINEETLELLRSLRTLGTAFSTLPHLQEDVDDTVYEPGSLAAALSSGGSLRDHYMAEVKRALRQISGITVHSRIVRQGKRIRHAFERGEINFQSVRVNGIGVNPHPPA